MKKTNVFEGAKIILALLALVFSFFYVKGNVKLAIFLFIGLVFLILSIMYAENKKIDTLKEFIKFFLCFLNITSLIYLAERIINVSYFNSVLESLYRPLFEKDIRTSIFMVAIFIITTIVLIGFNRLNLGEEDGKEREQKNEKEENFE